ncbi:uncharacterized protein LOC110419580 [Herrania umbratica]|uniref:Uncharacterized protein LOC110419580 n=1 Tax=Herrania umbratica TaxID=108875 RepID=A0A6J1APA5_9ROSI|nr:uncharacterized protein LOC110419580 [Herrania umbratica]
MKVDLGAFDLWEMVGVGGHPPKQRQNPTIAQMKQHSEEGAMRSEGEPTLYTKTIVDDEELIVSIYVDDILVTGLANNSMVEFKENMMREFEKTNLRLMTYFLGLEFIQTNDYIMLHQRKYALELLKRFKMENCKSINNPIATNLKLSSSDNEGLADPSLFRSVIRSSLYLSSSRPDIMFSTNLLSRFMHNPSMAHLAVAKRVLRYVKGNANYGIKYGKTCSYHLCGYSDNDWARNLDDSKSTSGFVFSFGNGVFPWNSKKQEVVAQSTTDVEYISVAMATNHAVWLRKTLLDLGFVQEGPTDLWVDNSSHG